MKHLLIALLVFGAASDNVCRDRRWRCELHCVEDTAGGSMERLRCYDRCQEDYLICREET
jgi:hypothetical protein